MLKQIPQQSEVLCVKIGEAFWMQMLRQKLNLRSQNHKGSQSNRAVAQKYPCTHTVHYQHVQEATCQDWRSLVQDSVCNAETFLTNNIFSCKTSLWEIQNTFKPYFSTQIKTNRSMASNSIVTYKISDSGARITGCHLFSFQATWSNLLRWTTICT